MSKPEELYNELLLVHDRLARRGNLSSSVIGQCAAAEKDFISALAAGMLTYGEKHGPVPQTMRFLSGSSYLKEAGRWIKSDRLVPGCGSDFIKGEPDPELARIDQLLSRDNISLWSRLRNVTALLHENDKMVFPNPACYTAAVCLTGNFPAEASFYWLIKGRLNAWTEIYLASYKPKLGSRERKA